jgi:hypothetical protein
MRCIHSCRAWRAAPYSWRYMTFLLFRAQSPGRVILGKQYWIHVIRSIGCKDFSEIVVSSSIRLLFVFIRFWFDFIYFVLRSHDSSQDYNFQIRGHLHAVCWIFTMQTIDNILNNSGPYSFISFWWYTWRHLYLDLLFSKPICFHELQF